MLRLAADENFDGRIVRGLLRLLPALDLVYVQREGLRRAVDPLVLEWAAHESRVVLTHDVKTMGSHAYDRVTAGLPMAGLILVGSDISIGRAVEQIAWAARETDPADWQGQVRWLPLIQSVGS